MSIFNLIGIIGGKMFSELKKIRNRCQNNTYEFCKEFMELSSKVDQYGLLKRIFDLNPQFGLKLIRFKTDNDIKEFRKDCIDTLGNEAILKVDKIFLQSFNVDNFIFIDYENEEVMEIEEFFIVLDYMNNLDLLKNLEQEEKDEILLYTARHYE